MIIHTELLAHLKYVLTRFRYKQRMFAIIICRLLRCDDWFSIWIPHLHVVEHIVKLDDEVAVGEEGGHVLAGDVEQDHVPQVKPSEPHLTLPCHPGSRQ